MDEHKVIRIETDDRSCGAVHEQTHPHLVHVYSEADETDHKFRVRANAALRSVFDQFYAETGLSPTELDRFKCEGDGEDLEDFAEETLEEFIAHGHCKQLVWIYSNRPIRVIVNTIPKFTEKRVLSFVDVVNLAYDNNPPTGENWEFTVSYRKGPRENPKGSLIVGHSVRIKDGMIFNVTATDKS